MMNSKDTVDPSVREGAIRVADEISKILFSSMQENELKFPDLDGHMREPSSSKIAFDRILENDTLMEASVIELKKEFFEILEKLLDQYKAYKKCEPADVSAITNMDNISYAFLDQVYKLCFWHVVFSTEEKEIILPLLVEAIGAVKFNIESFEEFCGISFDELVLRKRSALQFLMDNFGVSPEQNMDLLKETLQNYIAIVDVSIDKILGLYDPDLGLNTDLVYQNFSEDLSAMPETHVWWRKHVNACLEMVEKMKELEQQYTTTHKW